MWPPDVPLVYTPSITPILMISSESRAMKREEVKKIYLTPSPRKRIGSHLADSDPELLEL